jgi:GTP-binding protein
MDLMLEEESEEVIQHVIDELQWDGPVFRISAFNKQGTEPICYKIAEYLESLPVEVAEKEAAAAEKVEFMWDDYHKQQIAQVAQHDDLDDEWDEDDDDDDGVEIIYTRE